MRISLPDRISVYHTIWAAAAFGVLQLMEGAHFAFILCFFVYCVLWALAFNLAGGFRRTTGAYVFWLGSLSCILGFAVKAAIGEAADTNAPAAMLTMGIYAIWMALILAAVAVSQRIVRRTSSLAEHLIRRREFPYHDAALGCLALGAGVPMLAFFMPTGSGSFLNAFAQVNRFLPLAITLGTIDVVRRTGGRRIFGAVSALPLALTFLGGMNGFSKEGMFTPLACLGVALAYTRFRLRLIHWICAPLIIFTCFYVLVPIAQVGRFDADGVSRAGGVIPYYIDAIENLKAYRAGYQLTIDNGRDQTRTTPYFGKDVSGLERFTRFADDAAMINYTEQGHVLGFAALRYSFFNWFPHFLVPNKEKYLPAGGIGGPVYGKELGWLPPDDNSTGLSFSVPAESFHLGHWLGVLLVAPLIQLLFFISIELVCGDLRNSPWGVYYAVFFAHLAPEGGILSIVSNIWIMNLAMAVCMIAGTYLAPLIGSLFSGVHARSLLKRPAFGSVEELRS